MHQNKINQTTKASLKQYLIKDEENANRNSIEALINFAFDNVKKIDSEE